MSTRKAKLQTHYGSDITIAEAENRSRVVCFRNTGYKILSEKGYQYKKDNPIEERFRIVGAAAAIVLELSVLNHTMPFVSILQQILFFKIETH